MITEKGSLQKMNDTEMVALYQQVKNTLNGFKQQNLCLDMSRGKPGKQQLDLSSKLLDCLSSENHYSESGIDCRNYGGLDGIPEMKKIFADMLNIDTDEVIVGGNSSLSMMFDNIASNLSHGVRNGIPWSRQGQIKFICPTPGYDRHFAICEYFHIEMITVPMTEEGPLMDMVEELVSKDPLIKGMWCVPFFSNPDGCVYSEETVKRLANLKPAADDFRLYWDSAYCIHNFKGDRPVINNILRLCEKAGNPHMPLIFTSFSKISFSGAAVSAMASSKSNCEFIQKRLTIQTVGPDKLNQLRHVMFFKDINGVYSHMEKMAELIRPKFEVVQEALERNLKGKDVGTWNVPTGGYFISFNTLEGCAKRVVELCKNAGVSMTAAGATYPFGVDPNNSNIRIAPTYPDIKDLAIAVEIFSYAVIQASLEKMLGIGSIY